MAEKKNIVGFKKFSDIKSRSKSKIEEIDPSFEVSPERDSDRPMNPNLPKDTAKFKKPIKGGVTPDLEDLDDSEEANEKVQTFGKVAKFPKNVKASKAYNFLENVKVSKKSIWYIMVEKQDHELQMVKYNYREGVDLSKFVNELKTYYLEKYSKDKNTCQLIEGINVDGNDKYSMIKNIPLVEVEGRKMISVITEDLIKLLSK